MKRGIRSLIARAKRQEREHVRMAKYSLRHGNYVEALRSVGWAMQQQAFREGLEKAAGPEEKFTFVAARPEIPVRRGRRWR
jgi:hypothetical protein